MNIDFSLTADALRPDLLRFWEYSARKIHAIDKHFDHRKGTPVFTVAGRYTTRGWTEWTQGFEFGSALLQYEATGEKEFLEMGRANTIQKMAPHLTHAGVHDHGFNNISTYGNLLRMMNEGRIAHHPGERDFYTLALRVSGAVQAMRWTPIKEGGFIYSFNGPHSLFVDTIRSCRMLMISHLLGHVLMGENDRVVNLLHRAVEHLKATAKYSVFYNEGRDVYDAWGRTAHEVIFNTNDGQYRCPNSQQGYSGFTTWTRGLAWAMCGFAEELEFIDVVPASQLEAVGGKEMLQAAMVRAARATCDFYISHTTPDGMPYWDTGAPGLAGIADPYGQRSDPYNDYEPIDSSAAAIAAQGLLRLGKYLRDKDDDSGNTYFQAGITVCKTLLQEPYISSNDEHEGLILHSIYHRPNGWDHVPEGRKIPCGEASMWGDYHAREVMLYLHKLIERENYLTFFNGLTETATVS